MQEVPLIQVANVLADLKAMQPSTNSNVLLIGKNNIGDGQGGFYRWDSTDTTTLEDSQFLNTVLSSVPDSIGRWKRTFQRVTSYSNGVMVQNGGFKSFYVPITTDSSGKAIVYPTNDGTVNGTALFTTIMGIDGSVNSTPTTIDTVVVGSGSITADRKTVTYMFARNNTTTLGAALGALLGAVIPGLRAAPAGVQGYIRIDGV